MQPCFSGETSGRTATPLEGLYLTSDGSSSSRRSNGLVENEESSERPGTIAEFHIVFDVFGEITGMEAVVKPRSGKVSA